VRVELIADRWYWDPMQKTAYLLQRIDHDTVFVLDRHFNGRTVNRMLFERDMELMEEKP
jgi:hypothetical protein